MAAEVERRQIAYRSERQGVTASNEKKPDVDDNVEAFTLAGALFRSEPALATKNGRKRETKNSPKARRAKRMAKRRVIFGSLGGDRVGEG